MNRIKVYATKQNALNIRHPSGTPMKAGGTMWFEDGFTMRMLATNQVTTDEAKAWGAPTRGDVPATDVRKFNAEQTADYHAGELPVDHQVKPRLR
jgi:hypothetical protein